jgi:hypothetical protein
MVFQECQAVNILDKIPSPFWAVILAFMGVTVTLSVLFHHQEVPVALAVLGVGSNLVSGALGAFAGHAVGKGDVTTTSGPVTINPQDPK